MNNSAKILVVLAAGWLTTTAFAQDRIHYTGKELSNPACHDGQLSPVVEYITFSGDVPIVNTRCSTHGGRIIISRCWAYWNGQFFYHTWQILLTNTYRLHRLF